MFGVQGLEGGGDFVAEDGGGGGPGCEIYGAVVLLVVEEGCYEGCGGGCEDGGLVGVDGFGGGGEGGGQRGQGGWGCRVVGMRRGRGCG